MTDSEATQHRKKKNHHHRHQKRKPTYKQKAPHLRHICGRAGSPSESQLKDITSYKQNASLLRQGYGPGSASVEGQLQKRGAKKSMEPASSSASDSSDAPIDFSLNAYAPKTKVVVRRLPPSLSEKAFTDSIPSHFGGRFNWISFSPGKPSRRSSTSRAYIDFKNPEDVFKFFEEFNGHLFLNEKGTQYKAVVEYAPHQQVPKPFPEEDTQEGLISEDPEYLEFLDGLAKPIKLLPSAEVQLERKEAEKRSNLAAGTNETVIVTPLMEYVRHKRAQNIFMARKKKSACHGSSSSANLITSSKRTTNVLCANIKGAGSAVKQNAKLTYVPRHLHEANQCNEFSLDSNRKAVYEATEKVVMPEKGPADIVQSGQRFGASRKSGMEWEQVKGSMAVWPLNNVQQGNQGCKHITHKCYMQQQELVGFMYAVMYGPIQLYVYSEVFT